MRIREIIIDRGGSEDKAFVNASLANDICIVSGTDAEEALGYIRAFLGDYGGVDVSRAVSVCILLDWKSKEYDACYIMNADGRGRDRIAVNFTHDGKSFSMEDTEALETLRRGGNPQNVFSSKNAQRQIKGLSKHLSECERTLYNLFDFLEEHKARRDERPVFIYDLLEKTDESICLCELFEKIAQYGVRAFICDVHSIVPDACGAYDVIRV